MSPRPEILLGAAVRRVVDGDTLIVCLADGRGERVRLIGVDVLNTVARVQDLVFGRAPRSVARPP